MDCLKYNLSKPDINLKLFKRLYFKTFKIALLNIKQP